MICISLHLYLQHEKGAGGSRYAIPVCCTSMPYWRIPSEKTTEIFANTAANVMHRCVTVSMTYNTVIHAAARAGEGKYRSFNEITP